MVATFLIFSSTLNACGAPWQLVEEDIEKDYFPDTRATVSISGPFGSDTLTLSGPTTVEVDLASLADSDGDGREEVKTEIVQMELTGNSKSLGLVTLRLRDSAKHPFQRSLGEIEETSNDNPGVLDLPPFTQTGTADSFFDVFFEVEVAGMVFHNHDPKHMQTLITHKPPAGGERYESPEVIPLFDEAEIDRNVKVGSAHHTPNPVIGGDVIWPDKFGLLFSGITEVAPYIGLALTIVVTTIAAVIYVRHRKKKY